MNQLENENLLMDYVLGALDEEERWDVSQRLLKDPELKRAYRKVLGVMRGMLEAREFATRQAATPTGLAARTMDFIRANAQVSQVATGVARAAQNTVSARVSETHMEGAPKEFTTAKEQISGTEAPETGIRVG